MGTIELLDAGSLLSLSSIKQLTDIDEIYQGGVGKFIYKKRTKLGYYDTISKKTLESFEDFAIKHIKSIIWSENGAHCAVLCKNVIFLLNKNFKGVARISEGTKILGGIWTKDNILIYSTLHHIKYALSKGDTGILKSSSVECYPVALVKGKLSVFDHNFKLNQIKLDLSELEFKNAILKTDMTKVKQFIK